MKNSGNTYKYANRYGVGKGWRDRHKSEEYLEGMDRIFGKRCPKHVSQRLPCARCEELKDDAPSTGDSP